MKLTIQKILICALSLILSIAACVCGMYMTILANMLMRYRILFCLFFILNPVLSRKRRKSGDSPGRKSQYLPSRSIHRMKNRIRLRYLIQTVRMQKVHIQTVSIQTAITALPAILPLPPQRAWMKLFPCRKVLRCISVLLHLQVSLMMT